MKPKELFLLFIIYSIVPIFLSIMILMSKLNGSFFLANPLTGPLGNLAEIASIIIPWILFVMNSHIYLIKKVEGAGLAQLFLGITILQGVFALFALIFILSRTLF